MGHWKFGPQLSTTLPFPNSKFPFSCYKAMTDPAKKALTIARTARNENFESFNFRPKVGCILHRLYRHRRFHMILFKNSPLQCSASCSFNKWFCTHTHTYSTILVFILPPALQWPSNASISFPQILGQKKSFESPLQMSMDGPSPPHTKKIRKRKQRTVYPPICVCALLGDSRILSHHNGLKRISVCSIPFQQVLI